MGRRPAGTFRALVFPHDTMDTMALGRGDWADTSVLWLQLALRDGHESRAKAMVETNTSYIYTSSRNKRQQVGIDQFRLRQTTEVGTAARQAAGPACMHERWNQHGPQPHTILIPKPPHHLPSNWQPARLSLAHAMVVVWLPRRSMRKKKRYSPMHSLVPTTCKTIIGPRPMERLGSPPIDKDIGRPLGFHFPPR